MTKTEVMEWLESVGNEGTKKILIKHGAKEPFFGVKVGDMKKRQKKLQGNHQLALELYATGNSDAMYFAGLIDDEKQVTGAQLDQWMSEAYWYYLSEYTVPWLATDSGLAMIKAQEWIESHIEGTAAGGWATISSYLSVADNADVDKDLMSTLLKRVEKEVHGERNRVRYTMNGFVIALGACHPAFTDRCIEVSERIGRVKVSVGETACKVPFGPEYIQKIVDKGRVGKKKKMARC